MQPKIIDEVKSIGNLSKTKTQSRTVYDSKGISPTLCSGMDHGNTMPHICEQSIVAMRGRNPENPSDRTVGAPTEQRLEPNSQGICNTLTSVQKDNMVLEKHICAVDEQNMNLRYETFGTLTTDGSSPKHNNRVMEMVRIIDDTQGFEDKPRIYDDVAPTLRSQRSGLKTLETYSPYVNKKYEEFQEEHGYIPEFFNPYNKTELSDIAPTLTAQGESITKSGTVLKCDAQYRIRKLTPKECWRLMSFTDEDFHKAEAVNSNTQLYKQAGNSIVVNVLEAILGQMIPGKEDVYKTRYE